LDGSLEEFSLIVGDCNEGELQASPCFLATLLAR
jgi:hypothetical protein